MQVLSWPSGRWALQEHTTGQSRVRHIIMSIGLLETLVKTSVSSVYTLRPADAAKLADKLTWLCFEGALDLSDVFQRTQQRQLAHVVWELHPYLRSIPRVRVLCLSSSFESAC